MSAPAEALAAHRRALADLATLTDDELRRLWTLIDRADVVAARDALIDMLPLLGEKYGSMAAAVGADFYDDVRDAAEARGFFIAEPAALPGTARYEALARWGVDPLLGAAPDAAAALARITGGLQRIVANAARDTVTLNAVRDPAAAGWSRQTRPGGCGFCRMLSGRGAVYTEATVRFASHDHCHCTAVPEFTAGRPIDVLQYTASKRHKTEADRARVREWIAEHT